MNKSPLLFHLTIEDMHQRVREFVENQYPSCKVIEVVSRGHTTYLPPRLVPDGVENRIPVSSDLSFDVRAIVQLGITMTFDVRFITNVTHTDEQLVIVQGNGVLA